MEFDMKLKDTEVWRSGSTEPSHRIETREVRLRRQGTTLAFDFSLDAAGGGTTDVSVKVGDGDHFRLIQALVQSVLMPEEEETGESG